MKRKKQKLKISYLNWFLLLVALFLGAIIFTVQAYPQNFKTQVVLEKNNEVDLNENLTLNFSQTMIPAWRDMKVEIYPQQQFSVKWSNENSSLQIVPAKYWKPETKYEISISGGRSIKFTSVNAKLEFETQAYPKMVRFFPVEGEKDVTADIEDPIFAEFDQPLKNFNAKFVFNPAVEMNYDLDEGMKKIRLLPKDKMLDGQKYEVEIFVKSKDEGAEKYHKIFASYFETKKAFIPAEQWSNDANLRLEQAMANTKPQILSGKYADVNLTKQIVVRFENGKALDANYVSSGKPGMETPTGNFSIHNKFPRVWSKKYSLFMPYWMALVGNGEFGFHELPEWPGGYKEGANHLGRPVSHGCIRLGVGPAKVLYDWAEIGMPVVIHK